MKGHDFNESENVNFEKLFENMSSTGFQATNFSLAEKEINSMVLLALLTPHR